MEQRKITALDAGQRLDKYLHKLMPEASDSFVYKMLRKKNIVLNGKKAEGNVKIACDDIITLFLSDETFLKFGGKRSGQDIAVRQNKTAEQIKISKELTVLFENEHVLLINKPAGLLTQKAKADDYSLNEWLVGYLTEKGTLTEDALQTFRPSACNRLDRNTSGIVLCSKTVAGAQLLGELLQKRMIHKYYRTYVKGCLEKEQTIEGYLKKDTTTNKVTVKPVLQDDLHADAAINLNTGAVKTEKNVSNLGDYIKTRYIPIKQVQDKTFLEVELITGKPHQIRAHLASIGHPLLGDYKYGDPEWNSEYRKKYKISHQLLHAYRVEFPILEAPFEDLSDASFTAPLPDLFLKLE